MGLNLLQERVDRSRSAEEPSLGVANTASKEELSLLLGLDAFGNHFEVERASHFNDVEDDLTGGAVGIDGSDEGFIDFERIERERLQASETGVAGAEVVDGNAESPGPQRANETGSFGIVKEGAFGGFDSDVMRVGRSGAEQPIKLFQDVAGAQIACGHVDGDLKIGIDFENSRQISSNDLEDLAGNEMDDAVIFSQRDEVVGLNVALSALPANEGFGSDYAARIQFYDWLILDVEIILPDSASDHCVKRGAQEGEVVDRPGEEEAAEHADGREEQGEVADALKDIVLRDRRDDGEVPLCGADPGDKIALIEKGTLAARGAGIKPGGLEVAADRGDAVRFGAEGT